MTRFIVSTALATRDFQDAPRPGQGARQGDPGHLRQHLTDTGLVQRFVTDAGPGRAMVKSIALRLGVPWYAYDTVTFAGEGRRSDRWPGHCESRWHKQPWRSCHCDGEAHVGRHLMPGLSRKAAIAGIGATDFSKDSGRS